MGFNPVDLALGNMRAVNADNDRLRKENAKLRDGYGSMSREHSQTVVELSDALFECDRINAENAELRELVRHMGACIQHLDRTDEGGGCVCCPYQAVEHDCGFEQRMRELGIEVD